mmetsp:Transcript_36128/g.103917  ORF Transcript_36128/g.103917 Transcript_36128/m.103917 type:complete len:205 (+) Transcript_36128:547-1161(+)
MRTGPPPGPARAGRPHLVGGRLEGRCGAGAGRGRREHRGPDGVLPRRAGWLLWGGPGSVGGQAGGAGAVGSRQEPGAGVEAAEDGRRPAQAAGGASPCRGRRAHGEDASGRGPSASRRRGALGHAHLHQVLLLHGRPAPRSRHGASAARAGDRTQHQRAPHLADQERPEFAQLLSRVAGHARPGMPLLLSAAGEQFNGRHSYRP